MTNKKCLENIFQASKESLKRYPLNRIHTCSEKYVLAVQQCRHYPDIGPKSPSFFISRKSKLSWTLQQMFVFSTHGHVISGHSKATSLQSLPGLANVSTLWFPLTATEENIAQWSPVFSHLRSQNNGTMGNYR